MTTESNPYIRHLVPTETHTRTTPWARALCGTVLEGSQPDQAVSVDYVATWQARYICHRCRATLPPEAVRAQPRPAARAMPRGDVDEGIGDRRAAYDAMRAEVADHWPSRAAAIAAIGIGLPSPAMLGRTTAARMIALTAMMRASRGVQHGE